MTIVVLSYDTATVHYHTIPTDYLSHEQIEDYLYDDLGYSCNNINWLVTQPLTCESCRFWLTNFPARCGKGVTGAVTELLEFGCTLHQPKD